MSIDITAAPSVGVETYFQASHFLALEAKLLDEQRFEEWIELVDDDIIYTVPICRTKDNFNERTVPGADRIHDNKNMLGIRLNRIKSGVGWSETPSSVTVRIVGSVLVTEFSNDVISVESAMHIHRTRGDRPGLVIPVRRYDQLRFSAGKLKLLRRRAVIAETVLQMGALGIFL